VPDSIERAGNAMVSVADKDIKVQATASYTTYTKMYKTHPVVRAAVDKIAKTCVAAGYQFVSRDTMKDVNAARQKILSESFARSRAQNLLRTTYVDLLVYGDAYWHITPSRLGVPYSFVRVAPSQVSITVDRLTREVTSYITRDLTSGLELQFGAEEFVHFKTFDPDNDVYGLSPLESLQSTVAQDLFAQTYNENFFANSAQTGVVFNMRNCSKEEVDRNREFLKKEYTGTANAHKPLLLEGDVDVSKSVSSPADMQFIDGRKQLTTEILAVFDLPATKLGGNSESANRSQSAENDKSFRSETITPLQGLVEEAINEHLIFLVYKFDDILFQHKDVDPRDEEAQMALFVEGLSNGVYTLNWVRSKFGLPPVPGGDEAYIATPLGLMPVARIAEAADAILKQKTAPPPVAAPGFATPGGPQPPPGKQPPRAGAKPPASGNPGRKPPVSTKAKANG
jgi:HK97 family phage portal protein